MSHMQLPSLAQLCTSLKRAEHFMTHTLVPVTVDFSRSHIADSSHWPASEMVSTR